MGGTSSARAVVRELIHVTQGGGKNQQRGVKTMQLLRGKRSRDRRHPKKKNKGTPPQRELHEEGEGKEWTKKKRKTIIVPLYPLGKGSRTKDALKRGERGSAQRGSTESRAKEGEKKIGEKGKGKGTGSTKKNTHQPEERQRKSTKQR